jgi:transcriptional regulator with XRE-family HTH domain
MQKTKQAEHATELGRRVRAIRESHGWSQEQLGERVGLHRTYIGHIERGEVNPSLFNIVLVASGLEVDPSELVKGMTAGRRRR